MLYSMITGARGPCFFFRLVLALKLLLSTYFASLHYYLGLLSPWNPRVSFSGLLHAGLDSWNNSPCFQDLSVDMQNILSLLGSQLSYNTGISTLKCSTVFYVITGARSPCFQAHPCPEITSIYVFCWSTLLLRVAVTLKSSYLYFWNVLLCLSGISEARVPLLSSLSLPWNLSNYAFQLICDNECLIINAYYTRYCP